MGNISNNFPCENELSSEIYGGTVVYGTLFSKNFFPHYFFPGEHKDVCLKISILTV